MNAVRLLTIAVCLLLVAPGAHADAPEIEIARGHSRRGSEYYRAGRFAEAAAEFELAHRELPIAEIDYNLGRCYEALGDIDRSLDAYRRFLGKPISEADRADVAERVRLLEAASPRARERVARERDAAKYRRRWRTLMPAAAALGGAAVASGVASAVLYPRALDLRDRLATGCPPLCEPGLYDRADRTQKATLATLGIAIGIAAIDVALWGVALSARARAARIEHAP